MHLPTIKRRARSQSVLSGFGGYHHAEDCREGELYDEENLSAREYPVLTQRRRRRRLAVMQTPNGLYAKNGLLWVDGGDLVYLPGGSGEEMEEMVRLDNALTDCPKTFCGMGTKVAIFPDKLLFDTAERTLSPMEMHWQNAETGQNVLEDVVFQACDAEGNTYQVDGYGETEPESAADGFIFLRKNKATAAVMGAYNTLLIYNAALDDWTTVELGYCRISCTGIGRDIKEGDTVEISRVASSILQQLSSEIVGKKIVYAREEDALVVQAPAEERSANYYGKFMQNHRRVLWTDNANVDIEADWSTIDRTGAVFVDRTVPNLDWVVESNNRIWGCSSAENTIYACKLGDPTNWYSYRGTAADSYAVTVGSDGSFTGAAACMGTVLFFKENVLHKLYGSRPSDFQMSVVRCRGVQPGSGKSVVVLNERLYYKSEGGVMAYDGSLPTGCSAALGTGRYTGAVGGAAAGCYYISMQDEAGGWGLFCYDEARGLWHREGAEQIREFARIGENLFFLDAEGGIWLVNGESDYRPELGETEQILHWCAQTGLLNRDRAEQGYLVRLSLRVKCLESQRLRLEVEYDSSGRWERVTEQRVEGRQTILLPLLPRRCEHFALRLSGDGRCELLGALRQMETGSVWSYGGGEGRWQTSRA